MIRKGLEIMHKPKLAGVVAAVGLALSMGQLKQSTLTPITGVVVGTPLFLSVQLGEWKIAKISVSVIQIY